MLRHTDFQRKPPLPRWGWVVLGLGAAAMAAAIALDQQWQAEREAALSARAAHAEAVRARRVPVVLPPPTTDERRSAAVASEMARPWVPALRAVEAATIDPVYLTRLTVERNSGLVRIEADAPGFADAVAFVQRLASQPALRSPMLLSHQPATDPATGAVSVRFMVSAEWGAQ